MKNKQAKGRWLRAAALVLAAVCLLSASMAPALAVTQAEIDALKGDAKDLKGQKKEIQAKLNALAADKSSAMERKDLLDQQIANTSAQITNVEAQISKYAQLIGEKEVELKDAEEQEAAQYELFCQRVRAMEKRGSVSYWSVLFKAESFTDLLSRVDFINEIMASDQRVIDDLQTLQQQIADTKADLEESKTQQEAAKTELVSKKKELDAQRVAANKVIQELTATENATEAVLADMEAEEDAIQAEIQRLSRELAAQQAASGQKPQQSNPGGYIWPVNSRYITSTMGGRTSPGGIGSTNHKGTDIGRVGYTSQVYASKAGTVIKATYSRSYGNYVVISHGSGNTTLYAHMSSLKTTAGAYVNQGDVIGITGSTGNSTGPHLHFEITENGSRVNPLSHGAQPQKGYLSGYTLSGSA
nr:peptidoglycan DD-metalloendopeptidase family protein [uncultured Dysosmobacter sp.]